MRHVKRQAQGPRETVGVGPEEDRIVLVGGKPEWTNSKSPMLANRTCDLARVLINFDSTSLF